MREVTGSPRGGRAPALAVLAAASDLSCGRGTQGRAQLNMCQKTKILSLSCSFVKKTRCYCWTRAVILHFQNRIFGFCADCASTSTTAAGCKRVKHRSRPRRSSFADAARLGNWSGLATWLDPGGSGCNLHSMCSKCTRPLGRPTLPTALVVLQSSMPRHLGVRVVRASAPALDLMAIKMAAMPVARGVHTGVVCGRAGARRRGRARRRGHRAGRGARRREAVRVRRMYVCGGRRMMPAGECIILVFGSSGHRVSRF